MKKSKIFLAFLLIFIISSFTLLTGAEKMYLGGKTIYPYEKTEYTPAPKGYEPVFVYILGRHGSRNLSGFKYDKTMLELLAIAEKEGQITEIGKTLKTEVQKIADHSKDKYGLLTKLGEKELIDIGVRCGQNFKSLFATGKPIFADATYEKRAQESRDQFIEGLKSTGYKGEITKIFYEEKKDPYLRPYDIAANFKEYEKNGAWKKLVDKYSANETAKTMSKRVMSQFFTSSFLERLDKGEFKLVDLKNSTIIKNIVTAASTLYELYTITPSLKEDGFVADMKKYFKDEELEMFENILTAKQFYCPGPGAPDSNNVSTNIMAPLVKRMINEVDSALAKKDKIGVFSFSHAEAQIPLSAFLEIKGAFEQYADAAEAVKNWKIADFGPMAGNIQWIVYSNGKDVLVKMLLLEKEVAFPKALKSVSGPYYKWKDVKAYYKKKVEKLGIKLNSTIDENTANLINNF